MTIAPGLELRSILYFYLDTTWCTDQPPHECWGCHTSDATWGWALLLFTLGQTQMPQLHVEEVCDDATTKHFSQRLSLIGVAVVACLSCSWEEIIVSGHHICWEVVGGPSLWSTVCFLGGRDTKTLGVYDRRGLFASPWKAMPIDIKKQECAGSMFLDAILWSNSGRLRSFASIQWEVCLAWYQAASTPFLLGAPYVFRVPYPSSPPLPPRHKTFPRFYFLTFTCCSSTNGGSDLLGVWWLATGQYLSDFCATHYNTLATITTCQIFWNILGACANNADDLPSNLRRLSAPSIPPIGRGKHWQKIHEHATGSSFYCKTLNSHRRLNLVQIIWSQPTQSRLGRLGRNLHSESSFSRTMNMQKTLWL